MASDAISSVSLKGNFRLLILSLMDTDSFQTITNCHNYNALLEEQPNDRFSSSLRDQLVDMVDAILSKVMRDMNYLLQNEPSSTSFLIQDIANMVQILREIQMVLDDAEECRLAEIDVRDWLIKLKDAIYDTDDMIEGMLLLHRMSKFGGHRTGSIKHKVWNYFRHWPYSSRVASYHHNSRKISELTERLEDLNREKDTLNLVERSGENKIIRDSSPSIQYSSLPIAEFHIVGRVYARERVIDSLIDDKNMEQDVFSTIAIVGNGGFGKTTLADAAFNHRRIAENFDLRIWIEVHEDFNIRRITKTIIDSVSCVNYNVQKFDGMQQRVEELVSGKKFLLVLDDVWNQNVDKYDRLTIPFRSAARGSKVMITTQCEVVLNVFNASSIYELQGLSDEECWAIIRQKAFPIEENKVEYEDLGREIARKCKGMPLLSQTIGSLLRERRSVSDWLRIRDDRIWNLSELDEKTHVLPGLWMCYNNLPSPIKQCLSYCYIFPKGYVIGKDRLVQLWMAEGFLSPYEGKEMEDLGREYFSLLVERCFFVNSKRDDDGEIISCQMHDLVHNLARFVSRDDCFTIGEVKRPWNKMASRVRSSSLIAHEIGPAIPDFVLSRKSLRTFLVLCRWWENQATSHFAYSNIKHYPTKIFRSWQLLRVLDLGGTQVEYLPELVGGLKLLRYLDLSSTLIKDFPRSITTLQNLQTLRAEQCSHLVKLPKELGKMISLRHLCFDKSNSIKHLPAGIGKLTRLQTLSRLDLSRDCRHSHIKELKHLNNLRGSLVIRNLENIEDSKTTKESKLENKQYLTFLTLSWGLIRSKLYREEKSSAEEVLEHLKPSTTLKRLSIINYVGTKFPNWIGQITFINKVSIVNANHCEQLPALGSLPNLQYLSISGMAKIEAVDRHFYGFGKINGFPSLQELILQDMASCKLCEGAEEGEMGRIHRLKVAGLSTIRSLGNMLKNLDSLETLTISNCQNLATLGKGKQWFHSLRNLIIEDCPALSDLPEGLPDLPKLERLEITHCPKLKAM